MSWTKLAVTGLAIVGLIVICLTHQIWAAAFLGVLFALSLNGPAEWLRGHVHLSPRLSTFLVLLVVLTVFGGLGWVIGPSLVSQTDDMTTKLPDAFKNVLVWLNQRPWGERVLKYAENWSGMRPEEMLDEVGKSKPDSEDEPEKIEDEADDSEVEPKKSEDEPEKSEDESESQSPLPDFTQILRPIANGISQTAKTGVLLTISLVTMLFIAFDPTLYQRGVLWLVPRQHEDIAHQAMDRLCVAMRWWMLGRLASMAVIGVLTSLGMWLIGMPAPLALGALAGLLSFVPNVGPIAAALPGLLLALSQGPWMVVWALGIYLGSQFIETYAITPLIDQYTVSAPPGLLIVIQFVLAALAGAWGMIIATPLLVVIMVLIQQLYIREVLQKPIEVTGTE
jgi:predicted PurR-regulated permease PerM